MLPLHLDPELYFPADPGQRAIAVELFAHVRGLPIVSPHGHTDPAWFSNDAPFEDAVSLLLTPDHYLLRMLYSQGIALEALGLPHAVEGMAGPHLRRHLRHRPPPDA